VAVALVAFVVYALTAYRTLPGGDSGELIGAVVSGGVIHPPGYPLYSLLGGLFVHLPLGSLAFRLNLFSATCDALAAGVLTFAVATWVRSLAGGVAAGALFAFAPGVWRYAIAAEVFALNNLAIAVLVALAVLYAETSERRFAYAGAFVLGLGLSNHQTVVFTGVPVVAWALATHRDLWNLRALGGLVGAGALGLLPYLCLPILASHHAFVSWGAADTWDGFVTHVLRREYGTFRLAPAGVGGEVAAIDVLGAFWEDTRGEMGPWALALAALGVGLVVRDLRRQPRSVGAVLVASLLLSVGVMATLGNLPIETPLFRGILARFWQQPDLYLAAFAGAGAAWCLAWKERLPPLGGIAVAALLGAFQLAVSYRDLDHHAVTLVEQYAAEMLRAAPKGALVLTKGDLITNGLRYLVLRDHARPDVRIVDQELLATAWGKDLFERNAPGVVFPGPKLSLDPKAGFQLKQLVDANQSSPILVCGGLAPHDHTTDTTYGLWPSGLCDEIHSGAEPVSLDEWIDRSGDNVPRIDFTGQPHPVGSWEGIVWGDTWEVRQARAAHILTVAGANPARHKYLPVAVGILQRIVDENPDVPAHVHKNLAIAIGRAGITTPEDKAQAIKAWEGYLRVAPASDPQIPAIKKELAHLKQ
jgi:hypothetical protein